MMSLLLTIQSAITAATPWLASAAFVFALMALGAWLVERKPRCEALAQFKRLGLLWQVFIVLSVGSATRWAGAKGDRGVPTQPSESLQVAVNCPGCRIHERCIVCGGDLKRRRADHVADNRRHGDGRVDRVTGCAIFRNRHKPHCPRIRLRQRSRFVRFHASPASRATSARWYRTPRSLPAPHSARLRPGGELASVGWTGFTRLPGFARHKQSCQSC